MTFSTFDKITTISSPTLILSLIKKLLPFFNAKKMTRKKRKNIGETEQCLAPFINSKEKKSKVMNKVQIPNVEITNITDFSQFSAFFLRVCGIKNSLILNHIWEFSIKHFFSIVYNYYFVYYSNSFLFHSTVSFSIKYF